MYKTTFKGQDIEDISEYTDEWAWKGEKKKYFVCWANNKDLMKKMREERKDWKEDDFKLYLSEDQEGYLITWTKKKDKVMGLGKYQNEKTNAGILIAMMAADVDKKIYLIGYDYYSVAPIATKHHSSELWRNSKKPSKPYKLGLFCVY